MRLSLGDIDRVDFTKGDGLLPAAVQDVDSGAVLMMAYVNRDALHATFERQRVVFWSRSKQRLWEKGETSGHHLGFIAAHADCDRDALLILARPQGPVCHLGTWTCFGEERLSRAEELGFIATLEEVIERRIRERAENSYTAKLVSQGPTRIAQKVGEEGLEVAMAAATETNERVIAESADLVYHLLVLLKSRGLAIEQVVTELKSRHQPS